MTDEEFQQQNLERRRKSQGSASITELTERLRQCIAILDNLDPQVENLRITMMEMSRDLSKSERDFKNHAILMLACEDDVL
tara:strand:+ start:38 stop:280 length:243 start_codon:yes stop_codon:yes gene_type:complete